MFDKLRLKLTIIYTGIFSLLVVMIVTGCIILLGHSVLTHEKQEMRELIIHEGEEFVASGELPVSKHSIEVGRELAYMLQPGSDVLLHDQVSGSPVGQQLLALRSEWPQHDRKVKWVTQMTGCGSTLLGGIRYWTEMPVLQIYICLRI